ncbi:RHS repeat-associated core domain-containing protein [Thiobacillus denitrificans]|uniref:RHS repeat-associated core domain-containing protein n=1 Tax=Thiobacillus denitrificans TaxID=36861 RepID=UPI0003714980|nr:RHS repeat-associated core domain-containing protein [Thiobacillus denitrificans]
MPFLGILLLVLSFSVWGNTERSFSGTLTYTYDAADRLTSVTDSLGNQVTYAYDTRDNRIQDVSKDPNGTVVRQVDRVFNARDELSQINAAGSITQLVYDAAENLTQETNPNGNATGHQYDALKRLTQTIDALSGITTIGYDVTSQPNNVATPNGANTTYEVDDLGNVLKETSPDRGITTYTHDNVGNVLTRTDARGVTATFTYDALNRVASVSYPNAAENVVLVYDTCQAGLLCSVTDQSGTRSWAYDGFGRVISETWVRGGVSKTTSYTWTPGDDLASITYPSGRTVAYTRDAIGRVTAVSSNGSSLLSGRTYRADGLVKAQTWGNGLAETKGYDLQGRLTGWTVGTLLNRTFAYDANGNQIQKDSNSFQYDPLDRLIGEPSQILAYDANSNRLLDGTGPYSYTPASNRMATGPPGSVTLDAAGNTLAYAGQSYTYNQVGKLVSAIASGQIASYTYRHDGLRSSKTVNGITTFFHYDLDGWLIAETDTAGVTLREYVWDGVAPVAQIEAGVITYLHVDQLGTPRLGTNSAGAQVWAWDSDAFGTSQPTGSVTVNLRLPGQYYDAETGLHQNWNRTYHTGLGRYLESDPIGLAGGVNTYAYTLSNPLRWVDPLGLDVGAPGFGESLIPIWGSGREAISDFQSGRYVWGTINGALAVSDVFLIGSTGKAICKGAWKGGSTAWGSVRAWYGKTRNLPKRTPVHHWLIEQNSWLGKKTPTWIKNQPWNLMPMESRAFHDSVHGWGPDAFNAAERIWYGTPDWTKLLVTDSLGKGVNSMRNDQ